MIQRDTYKYHVKRGKVILHRGITNDLLRRLAEHKRTYGEDVKIVQVGKRVTRETALQWEREGGRKSRY